MLMIIFSFLLCNRFESNYSNSIFMLLSPTHYINKKSTYKLLLPKCYHCRNSLPASIHVYILQKKCIEQCISCNWVNCLSLFSLALNVKVIKFIGSTISLTKFNGRICLVINDLAKHVNVRVPQINLTFFDVSLRQFLFLFQWIDCDTNIIR